MDEARMFRRAFAIGLLTLGVALAGQVATSQRADAGPQRPAAVRSLYAHVAPRAESCLAQRVARAVIGAVLSGLA